MKIIFALSEYASIKTFITALKTLYGNSPDVLFNFSKIGLSLYQAWQEKNTERGKYFFHLQSTHFSRVLCNDQDVSFRFYVKEILQKLKSYKREIQEIFLTVTNEDKVKGVNKNFCLFEIILSLANSGNVIYKNGCSLETNIKAIAPSLYYDAIQNDKTLLLSAQSTKMDFLSGFKNEYLELTSKEDNVQISCLISQQRVLLNTISCFTSYNYKKFCSLYPDAKALIISPNHLQRYMEVCSKWKKEMLIYIGNVPRQDGTLKFYCIVKIDRGIFILKIKPRYVETPTISPKKEECISLSALTHKSPKKTPQLGTIASNLEMKAPQNSSRSRMTESFFTSGHSMARNLEESEVNDTRLNQEQVNNSVPKTQVVKDNEIQVDSQKSETNPNKRKYPFRVTQEDFYKKMKKNDPPNMQTEQESMQMLIPKSLSMTSKQNEPLVESIPRSLSNMTPQEHRSSIRHSELSSIRRHLEDSEIKEISFEVFNKASESSKSKRVQFRTEEKENEIGKEKNIEIEKEKEINVLGTEQRILNSINKGRTQEHMMHLQSSTRNKNLFRQKPTSFISLLNEADKVDEDLQRGHHLMKYKQKINENFSSRMKEALKDMKL